ncbi:hypothetical protein [Halomicrobium sp. LC1Hm]|uniref:hypothetical protein n=1 Tax=Halomicrobium sp. LC1Hm TaxID=2610902 RepID=UPI00129849CD|nr:hypothetical protein [Halomicrobium sp. LC1Hm]QGA81664.1 Uncharacterized protein LC1Hm_0600 [Halomicrobium sp. LC1Hm]
MNRRNLLIGIGTAAVGSGAVLGSGALTQVQADRTVEVTTVGDANGLIGLEGDGTYVTNDNTDTLTINIGEALGTNTGGSAEGLNDDATTIIDSVVTITNNSTTDVDIQLNGPSGSTPSDSATIGIGTVGDLDAIVTFELDSAQNPLTGGSSGSSGDSLDLKATVEAGKEVPDSPDTDGNGSLVIVANEN